MLKNYVLIGLAGLVLAVSLAYVLSIFASRSTDSEPKITSTVDEEELRNISKVAQAKDLGTSASMKSKPEPMSLSMNDQKESENVDKNPVDQHLQGHQNTPMPVHMEAHVPVDLNEFLQTREARRQRFAENYDKIINANPINLERQEILASQAEQALGQVESLSGVALDGVNCSDKLCRMTLTADSEESHLELRRMVAGIGVLLGSDAWTYSDPEQRVSYVYSSLPEGKLPNIEVEASF